MILLAVKVPNSNRRLIFPSVLFTDNQWQEAVFEKCKKSGEKLTAEKGNLFVDHRGNAVSNFCKSIFIVEQVALLFSGVNVQWPKVLFSQQVWKSKLQRF